MLKGGNKGKNTGTYNFYATKKFQELKANKQTGLDVSKKVNIQNSATKRMQQVTQNAEFPHFRKYLKGGEHPALIVGEQTTNDNKEEYIFRKVTHSPMDGRHLNELVDPNPNPADPSPMYIGKRKRHDLKKFFSKWVYPWKYKPPKE